MERRRARGGSAAGAYLVIVLRWIAVLFRIALAAHAQGPAEAPRCADTVEVWSGGRAIGSVCADALEGRTIVELGDGFAPSIFDPAHPYRAIYVALADERPEALPPEVEPERDLELFGIPPSLRVVRARLADEERHRCHDAIDDGALEALGERTLRASATEIEAQRERVARVRYARAVLERERAARGLSSIGEVPEDARPGASAIVARDGAIVDAIVAAQAHLACEGLLERHEAGVLDRRTAAAIAAYQRRYAVIDGGALDPETRAHMREDSRELDFRAALRSLRERVVDASSAIEDGSAAGAWRTVLGRTLDPPEMRSLVGHAPIEGGAPDWISGATEVAAIALGWTSAAAVRDARTPARVAIALPEPAHPRGARLELRAELDRGDVSTARRPPRPERRPILTLYARGGDREIALVRWPTTIGGWQPTRLPGGAVVDRYFESPVGRRVWRDVVAAPVWIPPETTPTEDLVRRGRDGRWRADDLVVGPGHRSAYGLAMMVHLRPITRRDGTSIVLDEGVRTHGSVSYASILRGHSHGCHRLHNHLAVRLAAFLLAHRDHVRHGAEPVRFARRVRAPDGSSHLLRITLRGVRYELVPPVEIEVLEGRVRGRR